MLEVLFLSRFVGSCSCLRLSTRQGVNQRAPRLCVDGHVVARKRSRRVVNLRVPQIAAMLNTQVRRLERQAPHQNNTQDPRSVDHAGQRRPFLLFSRSSLMPA